VTRIRNTNKKKLSAILIDFATSIVYKIDSKIYDYHV